MASSSSTAGNELYKGVYKGVELKCVVGNIVQCSLAAISVSSDPSFTLSVGVGNAVRRAGGAKFQKNLNDAKHSQAGGGVIVVDASGCGELKARSVILVALRNRHRHSMQDLFAQIFDVANQHQLESVAIPALGTGAYGLSFSDTANAIVLALQGRQSFGVIQRIQFMDLSPNSMTVVANSLRSLTGGNMSGVNVSSPSSSSSSASSTPTSSSSPSSASSSPANSSPISSSASPVLLSHPASSSSAWSISSTNSFSSASALLSTNSSSSIDSSLNSSSAFSISSLSSSSVSAHPAPPKKAHVDVVDYRKFFVTVSDQELRKQKSALERAPTNDSPSLTLPCSICLGDLISEDSIVSDSSVKEIEEVVQLTLCKHMFHRECIESAFGVKKQCPNCMKWYSAAVGNQPKNATMSVRKIAGVVPGCPEARGWHEIAYTVPSGVQTEQHLRPGVNFYGTTRIAYLPDSVEGTTTLRLLQLAFQQRLTFTIGDSVTTGQKNVVTWNGIHHKTSMSGGASRFGYPDADYLTRVQEELRSVGIVKEMLD